MKVLDILYDGVTYHFEEDPEIGGYVASVPDLPGCLSEGDTLDEAFANIREAFELYLEGSREAGLPLPEQYRTRVARSA